MASQEVPRRPVTDAEIAALPRLHLEEIGEHLYEHGNPFCIQCGTNLAEAAIKPCGKR